MRRELFTFGMVGIDSLHATLLVHDEAELYASHPPPLELPYLGTDGIELPLGPHQVLESTADNCGPVTSRQVFHFVKKIESGSLAPSLADDVVLIASIEVFLAGPDLEFVANQWCHEA